MRNIVLEELGLAFCNLRGGLSIDNGVDILISILLVVGSTDYNNPNLNTSE